MKISNAPFGCRYWSLEFGIGIGDLQYSCLDESENWHWNDSPIPLFDELFQHHLQFPVLSQGKKGTNKPIKGTNPKMQMGKKAEP